MKSKQHIHMQSESSQRPTPIGLDDLAFSSADRRSKDVAILRIVVAELKFRDVQRHIFGAHFVECTDYAALEGGPEA
jgi:hypothetical protein